jgi:hypothetical protein
MEAERARVSAHRRVAEELSAAYRDAADRSMADDDYLPIEGTPDRAEAGSRLHAVSARILLRRRHEPPAWRLRSVLQVLVDLAWRLLAPRVTGSAGFPIGGGAGARRTPARRHACSGMRGRLSGRVPGHPRVPK